MHKRGLDRIDPRGAADRLKMLPIVVSMVLAGAALVLLSVPAVGSAPEPRPEAAVPLSLLPAIAPTKDVSQTAYLPVVSSPPPTPTPTATPSRTATPTPTRTPSPTATSVCPTTSSNTYASGIAYQYDLDNPVRLASNHADKNLKLRSYTPNTDPALIRNLVDYGSDDPTLPPQFASIFSPTSFRTLTGFYRVYGWNWAASPLPGTRGTPLTNYRVTALGLQATPGETLRVPTSDYTIGEGMEVIVLFADERTIALRYGRQDSSGAQGYTVHVDNICTDPNLLALYNSLDSPTGPRYEYHGGGYSYNLPIMPAGKVFGTARATEIVVAIADTGTFMDPRSCYEWWQQRPGYNGSCPGHD